MPSTQRGNILFLILIAVALFAVLSYAVTKSSRGGGNSVSNEQAETKAAQLLQYGSAVRATMQRMRTVNFVPEYGFDFYDAAGPTTSNANTTCTSQKCRVFNAGTIPGQMTSVKFDETFVDPRFRASTPTYGGGSGTSTNLYFVKIVDIGTSDDEVILTVTGIRPEICRAVNRLLYKQDSYINEFYGASVIYSGSYTQMPAASGAVFGDEDPFWKGKSAGCIGRETTASPYGGDFFMTVMER